MADSASAVLPVGAGYGKSRPTLRTDLVHICRRRRWYRVFLRLPDDGHILDAESLHCILDKAIGRVQHRVSVCQAWTDCFWHRFGLDLGSYTSPIKYCKSINYMNHASRSFISGCVHIWSCRSVLVRSRSHRANPALLDLGLQSQAERAAMPHLP
jgi:hypothetical protein